MQTSGATSRWSRRPVGRLLAVLATVTAAAALAAPGAVAATVTSEPRLNVELAATGSMTDPDDTAGRLDVRRVSYRAVQLSSNHVVLTYRVRTWSRFSNDFLDLDNRNFVLDLNRDTEPGSEREVLVGASDGALVGDVVSLATRQVIGTVAVSRPSSRTIEITGSRRTLGARSYFWTSNDHVEGSPACGDWHGAPLDCQDNIPGAGTWLQLDPLAWPGQP